MFLQSFKKLYFEYLPLFAKSTTTISTFVAICNELSNKKKSPAEQVMNVIGLSTIGLAIGMLYPISFPLLGYYVSHKNYSVTVISK